MNNFLDKLRGSLYSRTMRFGGLAVVLGLIDQFGGLAIGKLIPPDYAGLVVSALGVLMWLLRWVTDKPLESKNTPEKQ
jgi:hypothetical protein